MSVSSSSESKIIKPPRSLLLKHEILSPECDLFRVCLPRRLFAKRLGRIILFVLLVGVGHWWMKVEQLALTGLIIAVVLLIISFILSQAIEERILFIRGLGVQYSVINGFSQETTNFYPFEQIKSFYIFESFDGLKVGDFFCIKYEKSRDRECSEYSGCVVLFENMRPPVEFLRRVYRKFTEVTND